MICPMDDQPCTTAGIVPQRQCFMVCMSELNDDLFYQEREGNWNLPDDNRA